MRSSGGLTRRGALAIPWLLGRRLTGQAGSFVLRGVMLIDGRGGPAIHASVSVKNGQIAEVIPGNSASGEQGAPIVDGGGRYLIPGLWDMHVHLSYTKVSALPALLANGVTTVRDIGGRLSEIDQWRGQIQAGALPGPRIFRSGPMLNGRFAEYQFLVEDAAEARGAVRALHRAGVDFIKHHRMTPREAYFGLAAEAKKLGMPFAGHIPRTVSPEEASDAGQSTIEHVETLFEGTFSGARDDIPLTGLIERFKKNGAVKLFERFAKNGNHFTPTLVAFQQSKTFWDPAPDPRDRYLSRESRKIIAGYLKTPPPRAWIEDRATQFPHHLELVGMAQRAGVSLLAGTDLASRIYPGFSLHDDLALLVKAGLSPMQALQAATRNCAQAMKQEDLGTIEPGKAADMVLLEANPLENIRNVGKIRSVVNGGKLLDRAELDGLLKLSAEWANKS